MGNHHRRSGDCCRNGLGAEAAVVGGNLASFAAEVAAKKVAKVYAVESPKLEPYTPDAFAFALKQFLTAKQPKLVLMPHTYQVRDFVPKLATAMGRTVISDCIGFRHEGGKLVFTRQMFQGKLAADVSFTSDAPWFATFQNGAFRGDKAETGASAAPVETVTGGNCRWCDSQQATRSVQGSEAGGRPHAG